jgi:hypothetical protein
MADEASIGQACGQQAITAGIMVCVVATSVVCGIVNYLGLSMSKTSLAALQAGSSLASSSFVLD